MSDALAQPHWFGPEDRPLFGWLHLPADRMVRAGVLLCQPFGDQRLAAHWTFRSLAEQLAEDGLLVLRFDYEGTGDSAGSMSDPGRPQAWASSVRGGLDELRSLGAPQLALVGMRLGALVAAAAGTGELAATVWWDPCVTGKAYLREQTALAQLGLGPSSAEPGDVEMPGFVIPAGDVDAVRALDLFAQSLPTGPLLVLNRPDRGLSATALARLSEAGAEVRPALGQAELLDVPTNVAQMPASAVAEVAAWLGETLAGETTRIPQPPLRRSATVEPGIVETAVELVPGQSFGIVTQGPLPPTFTVLLLNTANEPHLGPGRLWCEAARAWARLGIRCVRADVAAVGDSPVPPGLTPMRVYTETVLDEALAMARAALTDPLDDGSLPQDPKSLAIIGLCSGAVVALEASIHLGARAVMGINYVPWVALPGGVGIAPGLDPLMRVPDESKPSRLAPVKSAMPRWGWVALDRLGIRSQHAGRLRLAAEAGVDVLLPVSDEDVVPFVTSAYGDIRRLSKLPNFTMLHEPRLDHAAKRAGARQWLLQVLSQRLGGYVTEPDADPALSPVAPVGPLQPASHG